jgi:adenylylsulfate kinase-like enzyme
MVRKLVKDGEFVEIHLSTPLEVCEQRDPKGLYVKARTGKIRDFTGVSSPYEAPENPELNLDTSLLSVQESVEKIIRYLESTGRLKN